jgi:hypothetical protein
MNSFEHTQLAGADFRGLNLKGANFSHCDLKNANFSEAIITNANFSNANLTETKELTSDQLDTTTTYANAKLPPGIYPCWDKALKLNIQIGLNELKAYGEKLRNNKVTGKGDKIVALANELSADLENCGDNPAVPANSLKI